MGGLLALALGSVPQAASGAPQSATGSSGDTTTTTTTTVRMAAGDQLTFTGHGWGHGRGMGQYGALGYAVDHGWNHQQILGHFYGNTSPGNIGNPEISVELTGYTGSQIVVYGTNLSVAGAPVATNYAVVRVNADNTVSVSAAGGCAGPEYGSIGTYPPGTRIGTETAASYESLVRICESATATRAYRGAFTAQRNPSTGQQTTFNIVNMNDYLLGVVPRESPASWGSLGSGRGMQALKAQAVAARSYAWVGSSLSSGARTCDTTSCQVYGGAARWPALTASGPVLESTNTNEAVMQTAGEIRVWNGSGAPVRTEFSSSTGGYTVGGSFPAVPDVGDAISINPNHTWSATYSTAEIAGKLGMSGVRSVTITSRNGLGDWGGRVTGVVVVDAGGASRSYTGGQFRSALGTDRFKSDWFTISGATSNQAEAVVRALYQDVLNREPDPAGLAAWTASVTATGNPQVVTNGIVYSRERLATMVATEYRGALGREPEAGGLENWIRYLEQGAGVSDLQVGVYASQESLNVLGGGDTPTWVGAMYAALLGRPASQGEMAAWTQVALTQGRVLAVTGIAKSAEAGEARLSRYYQVYLGRGLDPAGIQAWLPYMSGAGDFQVPGFIGGSPEYWARSQTRFP